ncbi:tetratricopeptide repeat protein [Gracilinema caldarium]|uniref:tetratricopeptide repeat protein n=1 Tax=Gracilinema caldarium TaxID=215591 RepID=UPI0026EC7F1F|nr:tetratricopeptide repeat protein [Gracilinema caldarium]
MNEQSWFPDRGKLQKEFDRTYHNRVLVVEDIKTRLEEVLHTMRPKPTVKGRAKSFQSYYKKYIRLLQQQSNKTKKPAINDLVGLRIVCTFIEDLSSVETAIQNSFQITEVERKGSNYSFKEFGYESTHILIKIPEDIIKKRGNTGCDIAEIQIRTILQDAWAEVEHELVYKAEFTPFDEPMKRKLAAVNASLSLADIVFQEIRDYQRQLNRELGKRRESFFKKIEEATDGLLFKEVLETEENRPRSLFKLEPSKGGESIDDLLLDALYAHNNENFDKAISLYTRILQANPNDYVKSIIYKHRGMAHFAQSHYQEAIEDFSQSLAFDHASYKAAYYRAVVKSVLQQYSEAIDDFSLSLEINPYQFFALYRRGQAYYHLGDFPKALADCDNALLIEPENAQALRFRELLLKKLGH